MFPSLHRDEVGGIQTTGRLAVSLIDELGSENVVICCGRQPTDDLGLSRTEVVSATTRPRAAIEARRFRGRAETVLVWHVSMLKLLPALRGKYDRVVVFLHGVEAWVSHSPLVRHELKKADLLLTNSDYTWERVIQVSPFLSRLPHKTVHLGYGVPTENDPPREETRAALMLGRLARSQDHKGHRDVISVWPNILLTYPEARLWIAGPGDLERDLHRLAESLGVSEQVSFFGKVTEAKKSALLASCKCFVMPSRSDGFGLVYLEAMRFGRPCLVGTDAGREVVRPPQAGLSADAADHESLAEALLKLLGDGPEWHKWSEGARDRYVQRFTEDHFRDRFQAALALN